MSAQQPVPAHPVEFTAKSDPNFKVLPQLLAEIDELITHYPVKRSASLMLLHAVQEHFGYISKEAIEWIAAKLELQPINVPDGKVVLPPKDKVLSSMEELIHQFLLVTQGVNCPPGEVYFGAENPKGELGFYINSRGGGTPHRMKIRSPSFVNISILHKLMPGHMISDTVSILGSLDFVMGECDR